MNMNYKEESFLLDFLIEDIELSKWSKRKAFLIVIFSTVVVYYLIGTDNKHIINIDILAPVFCLGL